MKAGISARPRPPVKATHRATRKEPGAMKALLAACRIIPAIRSESDTELAVKSASRIVYLLGASLSTLDHSLVQLRAADKEVMVNLDLFAGLARDAEAVAYLATSGISGIISTHTDVLNAAAAHGLYTIQRTFMLDSSSVDSSLRSLNRFIPDALELLPAPVAPRILPRLQDSYPHIATIVGGLITNLQEADQIVQAGVDAVSTGNPDLWLF